ncbi:MAG: GNAT family N-acetyltransferase [Phototrophicales bacterium]|nr:MAG: GNAT family N-acetyltransferase [Phototrophicales bacterium]
MNLKTIQTEAEIRACYQTYHHLRPHLTEEVFVAQVLRQMQVGFQMVAIEADGVVVSAIGFRLLEYLAWGKIMYIDDLITHPDARGRGYGSALLQYVKDIAIANDCDAIHLDSGYQRHHAHRLYLNEGFVLSSHHFEMKLKG